MNNKRLAVVTGASRGIGNAVAVRLAREGYNIVTMGTSSEADAEKGLKKIKDEGAAVAYVRGNLADKTARRSVVDESMRLGGIDLLVNNASMAPRVRADILEMSAESLEEVLSVNLTGTFLLTQTVANIMAARVKEGRGGIPSIINISSISSDTVSLNRAEYCLSKAGISMATQLFAVRLAEFGIPVFEIRPGIISTDMIAPVKQKYEKLIEGGLVPFKRMGLPEDVANAVWALASGRFTYSTGLVINVDGGLNIKRL